MADPVTRFGSEKRAAATFDMRVNEFLAHVDAGHLPKPREIVPGVLRWDLDELCRIARGEAAEGMGNVSW